MGFSLGAECSTLYVAVVWSKTRATIASCDLLLVVTDVPLVRWDTLLPVTITPLARLPDQTA